MNTVRAPSTEQLANIVRENPGIREAHAVRVLIGSLHRASIEFGFGVLESALHERRIVRIDGRLFPPDAVS